MYINMHINEIYIYVYVIKHNYIIITANNLIISLLQQTALTTFEEEVKNLKRLISTTTENSMAKVYIHLCMYIYIYLCLYMFI
jgi:hypothetical protein